MKLADAVLEKIVVKLKQNTSDSAEMLGEKSLDRIEGKIDNLIQTLRSITEKYVTDSHAKIQLSSVIAGLEDIRDLHSYHKSAISRATRDFDTYVYVLETLHDSNGGSNGDGSQASDDGRKVSMREAEHEAQPQQLIRKSPQPERVMQHPAPNQQKMEKPRMLQPHMVEQESRQDHDADMTNHAEGVSQTQQVEKAEKPTRRFKFSLS
jgi:hypothetical protein